MRVDGDSIDGEELEVSASISETSLGENWRSHMFFWEPRAVVAK